MRALAIVCLLLTACAGGGTRAEGPVITFDVDGRRVTYRIEIADSPAERATGLMRRRSLPRDAGMLFLFADTDERDFHMLNTLIPLDLVSMRAGRVVGVQHMVPCPTAGDCPTTTTPPADAVLEINAGEARRAGIEPGTLVESEALLT